MLESLLKETLTQVFSFEYYENLRTPILKNICERLLLKNIEKNLTNLLFIIHNLNTKKAKLF